MGEQTVLEIGTIILDQSDWAPWRDVLADNRGGAGVSIPNMITGVYEVRSIDSDADSAYTSARQETCGYACAKVW
jgi:hypothetical protein